MALAIECDYRVKRFDTTLDHFWVIHVT